MNLAFCKAFFLSSLCRFPAGRWPLVLAAALIFPGVSRGEGAAPNLIPAEVLQAVSTGTTGELPRGMRSWCPTDQGSVAKFYLTSREKSTAKGSSLCIERLSAQGPARVTIAAAIPVKPGGRYSLSCMARATERGVEVFFHTKPAQPTQGSEAPFKDPVSHTQGADVHYGGQLLLLTQSTAKLLDGFNRLEMAFTVPDNAASLQIEVGYGFSSGAAWFDDFALYSLD